MANGGIIGKVNNPTSTTATGVWQQEEQYEARVTDTWPERALFTTKSARFNTASSDYLNRTATSGNRQVSTFSGWIKKSSNGVDTNRVFLEYNSGTNYFEIRFRDTNDDIRIYEELNGSTGFQLITNRSFRDPSAWYHIVVAIDTTQGTASNRIKLYINGVQETSFATETYPAQNYNVQMNVADKAVQIGAYSFSGSNYFNGYMSEIIWVDGTALAPTSFGVANSSGFWSPIPYTGTFGTNGFNLQFENAAALGTDSSPNGNTFTVNNLTSVDQATDYPEVNFCTWNSLDNFYSSATFAFGNTTVVTPNASLTYATATIGLSSGRWYFEVQPFDPSDNNNIGIVDHISTSNSSNAGELQFQPRGWCYRQAGDVYNNNSSVSGSWDAYSAGVTIGVFVDLVDNKIYWSRNGVMQNSGTGVTITAAASTDTGFYFPAVGDYVTNDDTTFKTNFGGSSSFTISSGVTDDNGYGTFEYTPNVTVDSTAKKFYSINTANLAEFG